MWKLFESSSTRMAGVVWAGVGTEAVRWPIAIKVNVPRGRDADARIETDSAAQSGEQRPANVLRTGAQGLGQPPASRAVDGSDGLLSRVEPGRQFLGFGTVGVAGSLRAAESRVHRG